METKKKRYFSAPKKMTWDLSGKCVNDIGSAFNWDSEEKDFYRRKVYRNALRDKKRFNSLVRRYGASG